jgi:transcriptional regulator GlxA family with amidase domain
MSADEAEYSRQIYCRWKIVADDYASPITASCGAQMLPQEPLGDLGDINHLVVVGGIGAHGLDLSEATRQYIRSAYEAGITMVGLCTGSFVLADLGLLDGRRCALHPAHVADFRDRYPRALPVTGEMYVADRNVITCPGGVSGLDVAFHLVETNCGKPRAVKGLSLMLFNNYQSQRRFRDRPYGNLAACGNAKVERAIDLMERSIASPYSIAILADQVGCSLRELCRLFREYGNTSPSETWRNMRITQGHWLLLNSKHSIAQIASECGFADAAHFTRWFKALHHETPDAFRRRRRRTMLADAPLELGATR